MSGDTHAAFGAALSLTCAATVGNSFMAGSKESMVVCTGFAIIGALFASLRDIKLRDYNLNDGKLIELPIEIGTKIDNGICGGYVIINELRDGKESLDVAPIVVSEENWKNFIKTIKYEEDKSEFVLSLLMER